MASSSITLQTLHLRSNFPAKTTPNISSHKPYSLIPRHSRLKHKTCVKFNLSELLGGRGLCNGEEGLEKLLKEDVEPPPSPAAAEEEASSSSQTPAAAETVPEDAFDKELMGLTGGFPGGEMGLQKFIDENPPPSKTDSEALSGITKTAKKPKAPELPLLMPGMIAVVKDRNSPYYMYCGIIQRITDGKAGLLLEGGVWDRLITFRLEELERREKGPPGKSPRSVILEKSLEKDSQSG
ncbi:NAD(P)H-quinone oxidoreductase subunit S, chloroplastic [Linum perenne]